MSASVTDLNNLLNVVEGTDPWGRDNLGKARSLHPLGNNYVYFASAGPLTYGHTLIVPTSPSRSLLESCGTLDRYSDLLNESHSALSSIFGQGLIFEHGLDKTAIGGGCGVNHAHAHYIPMENPIPAPALRWATIDSLTNSWNEYLLWSPWNAENMVFCTSGEIQSQYLRKYVARHLSTKHTYGWNWRTTPNLLLADQTDRKINLAWERNNRAVILPSKLRESLAG